MAIVGCTFFSWLGASPASAQTAAPYPTQTVQPVQPAQPEPPVPPAQPVPLVQPAQPVQYVGLTPEQLQAFSALTGDTPGQVSLRLTMDPRLKPIAASAADARMSRRGAGKVMAIVGFTILGVGDIVGSIIMVTTPGYPNIESGHEGRFFVGVAVAVVSLGVGLGLAIPGLVKMARPGDEENRALDSYTSGPRQAPAPAAPPQVLGKTITAPVFSLAF